jgi:hypothetical protein
MYVCMCVCTSEFCTDVFASQEGIDICMDSLQVSMNLCVCSYMHTHTCLLFNKNSVFVSMNVCSNVCVCVSINVCVCLYMYTHTYLHF